MDRESFGEGKRYSLTRLNIPFRQNKLLKAITIFFIIFWIVMAISPTDRKIWFSENILPVGTFLILVFTYKKFRFSNLSYLLMFIFFVLHLYAAHYTYDKTPFDIWLKASYHVRRSYFDRVVHFAFGLFWTYPIREFLVRFLVPRGFGSYVLPVAVVLSLSALFEIIEMFAAVYAGQVGVDYIGLQGDIYDTQKDMELALIGGILSMGVLAGIGWAKKEQTKKEMNR